MQKRHFARPLSILLMVLTCLLLGPAQALAHGDQLITAYSWFGVLFLGAAQWIAWTSYARRVPPTKGPRLGLFVMSAACALGALYTCLVTGELHYGHATAPEYVPAVLLAGLAGAGLREVFRSQRPER